MNISCEAAVYVSCEPIFKGDKAKFRQKKSVDKLLKKHKKGLKDLLEQHNFETISETARLLLSERVFESTANAKLKFPYLFELSDDMEAEREASEARDALLEVDEGQYESSPGEDSGLEMADPDGDLIVPMFSLDISDQKPEGPNFRIPSLYPCFLDYGTQHAILNRAQAVLEEACFYLAKKRFPSVLRAKGWHEPEAGELSEWTKIFSLRKTHMVQLGLGESTQIVEEKLRTLVHLRNTAVHREHVSVQRVQAYLDTATSFLRGIGDQNRCQLLQTMLDHVKSTVQEIQRSKNLLLTTTEHRTKLLAAQIAVIMNTQRMAVEEMQDRDTENCRQAGQSLREALGFEQQSILIPANETLAADFDSAESEDESETFHDVE